eukprot:gi/632956677/ref/XP_007894076.1/ PREDICTED: leukemia NUP98 fusion partner 1 [Callorhinchus milii]
MEQEEDEDIAFAKWMSSFWGHNLVDEGGKDVRARQRRQSKAPAERRASCPAQLSAVRMSQMHSTTKVPTPVSLKGFKEIRRDKEDRGHHLMKAKTNEPTLNSQEENKRSSVQTFTSTFQKHLKFRSRNTLSLAGGKQYHCPSGTYVLIPVASNLGFPRVSLRNTAKQMEI